MTDLPSRAAGHSRARATSASSHGHLARHGGATANAAGGERRPDGGAATAETTKSLRLEEASKTFTFTNVAEKPTPSILRNFSAPVKLDAM